MQLGVFDQIKKHKLRAVKTLLTCFGYACVGLQAGVIGPSLLDLSVLVQCQFDQITYMVTGRSVGYAIGSITAGVIARRTNPQMVICLTLLVSALFHFAMPVTKTLNLIIVLITLTGIVNGVTDTTSNMFIIKLWAKECPPFLQALHFSYGVGSLIAPMLVEPFLKESEEPSELITYFMTDKNETFSVVTTQNITALTPDDIELIYPYFMVSIFITIVACGFLVMFIKHRVTDEHPSRKLDEEQVEEGSTSIKVINPKVKTLVVAMTSTFTLIYVGLEANMGTFIPAYAHKGPLHVSKKTGAMMSSVYWLFFTCFRLVAVILSSMIGSTSILVLNLVNSLIGCALMIVSQHNVPLFWFACVYVGIGLSSTWGSLFGFIESQFAMTANIVTCFTVGACIGCSVFPAAVGYFIDIDTSIFVYFNVTFSIVVALLFVAIFFVCKHCLFSYQPRLQQNIVIAVGGEMKPEHIAYSGEKKLVTGLTEEKLGSEISLESGNVSMKDNSEGTSSESGIEVK